MPTTSQDFVRGIDITGLTVVSASEMIQLVDAGRTAEDKGLSIVTTDTALDTPDVPDPSVELEGVTPTWWQNYIWIRRPFAGVDAENRIYTWNPNKESDATYLKWESPSTNVDAAIEDAAEALAAANTAQSTATAAFALAGTAVSRVDSVELSVTDVNTRISALQGVTDDLRTDVDALESAVALGLPFYGVSAVANGLIIQNNVTTPLRKIDIDVAEIIVTKEDGESKLLRNVDLTIDIDAAVGFNSVDAPLVSGRWYYIWIIHYDRLNVTGGLMSQSATDPAMPVNFEHKALVGVVFYLAPNGLVEFFQRDRNVWYENVVNIFDAKASGVASGVFVTLAGADLTAFESSIPPNAKTCQGNIGMVDDGSTPSFDMGIAGTETGLGLQTFNGQYGSQLNGYSGSGPFNIPLKTRNLWWNTFHGAAVAKHRLDITGFTI